MQPIHRGRRQHCPRPRLRCRLCMHEDGICFQPQGRQPLLQRAQRQQQPDPALVELEYMQIGGQRWPGGQQRQKAIAQQF